MKSIDREKLQEDIAELREKLAEMEERLIESLSTFDITLRVTTYPSTWSDGEVDTSEIRRHFENQLRSVEEALFFIDEGDSIKVQKVTEILT